MRPVKRIILCTCKRGSKTNYMIELTQNEEKESSEITASRGRIILRNINGSAVFEHNLYEVKICLAFGNRMFE